MKHKNFPLIMLVLLLIVGLMAAIYISNTFPSYNAVVDTAFSDIAVLFKFSEKRQASLADGTGITDADSSTVKESAKKSINSDIYEITDNGYTLASAGKNRWYYESNWPFIAELAAQKEYILAITAEPAFLVLSYENGELLSKQPCPVYPGKSAGLSKNILTLEGRDEKTYTFQIESDFSLTALPDSNSENGAGSFISALKPDQKAADFIKNRIREWAADDKREIPEMKVYTGHINREGNGNFYAQKNDDADMMFYVYTPDKQGIFQIGLADENGVWIQANAFVAVFGENGDMKQVSIDYVANKPQVKLHLSENELYYIVAGWAKDMYNGTATWLQIAESR